MAHKTACIIASKHYPYHRQTYTKSFNNVFTLGLGSNVAKIDKSSVDILESVFMWLFKHSYIRILDTSPIWRNPPFGFEAQDDFYNALIVCSSNMDLVEVYRLIFYIERRFGRGRKRLFKNAPRSLDIDLIMFNDKKLHLKHLHLPHKFYAQRSSVMLPLSFIRSFNVKL